MTASPRSRALVRRPTAAQIPPSTPRARLSITRLLLLLSVIGGATWLAVRGPSAPAAVAAPGTSTWLAPYVDVTLTPAFPFGDTRFNPSATAVLGFVVADHELPCEPSWGGYYRPDEATTGIDLDRRIESLRRRGGEPVVSFGGAVNTELAVACTDPEQLADAYASVLERYDASAVDLDLEGAALTDGDARTRRAAAFADVQSRFDDGLEVWLTLPVATTGLTSEGVATLDAFLAAGVDVAGVNAMTMNFGTLDTTTSPSDAAITAMRATASQVRSSYRAAGQRLSEAAVWAHLVATVMVGRNDVRSELFGLGDAERLLTFAEDQRLGRLSLWSLNRDAACGPEVDGGVARNECSGIDQEPTAFTTLFAGGATGTLDSADIAPADPAASRTTVAVDDPATAPYPIWRPGRGYQGGDEVVWHGNVYQAKWWNENSQPDAPAANAWDTPWTLVGPVLPTDRPAPTTTIPDGIYPKWDADQDYRAGTKVQYHGVAYQAKWFASGIEPSNLIDDPWDSPWAQITPSADDLAAADITTSEEQS